MTTPTGPELIRDANALMDGIQQRHGFPDPGPVPDEPPLHSRKAKIAAIHSLADYLQAHPDYPMPDTILASAHIAPADQPDELLRIDVVDRFHRDHDQSSIHENASELYAHEVLLAPMLHGIRITYMLSALFDPPQKRYKA